MDDLLETDAMIQAILLLNTRLGLVPFKLNLTELILESRQTLRMSIVPRGEWILALLALHLLQTILKEQKRVLLTQA